MTALEKQDRNDVLDWAYKRAKLKGPLVFDDGTAFFDPAKKFCAKEKVKRDSKNNHGQNAVEVGAAYALKQVMKIKSTFTVQDVMDFMSEELRSVAMASGALSRNCRSGVLCVVQKGNGHDRFTIYGIAQNKLSAEEPVVDFGNTENNENENHETENDQCGNLQEVRRVD